MKWVDSTFNVHYGGCFGGEWSAYSRIGDFTVINFNLVLGVIERTHPLDCMAQWPDFFSINLFTWRVICQQNSRWPTWAHTNLIQLSSTFILRYDSGNTNIIIIGKYDETNERKKKTKSSKIISSSSIIAETGIEIHATKQHNKCCV